MTHCRMAINPVGIRVVFRVALKIEPKSLALERGKGPGRMSPLNGLCTPEQVALFKCGVCVSCVSKALGGWPREMGFAPQSRWLR